MKNVLKITAVIGLIVATVLFSCRKNQREETVENPVNPSLAKLNVNEAKVFHEILQTKQGNYDLVKLPNGKTEKAFKKVDFSKPYIGENETSFFVEVPITYSIRSVTFSGRPGMSTATLKKMLPNSFDRLVITKDKATGFVSEKIVTVIPSTAYKAEEVKNLYNNNHYQSMEKDFSGIVSSKSWKGQFLSSQYFFPETFETKPVFGVTCVTASVSTYTTICEDYDLDFNRINCDYVLIDYFELTVCLYDPVDAEVLHNHGVPLPPVNDPYWGGFPDPQNIPTPFTCPGTPRVLESPIMYSGAVGTAFSMTLYDACYCLGYSWVIFEDVNTGHEYPVAISNQTFLMSGCTAMWKTEFTIPTNIPNGDYFTKVWLDGDVFYHQFQDGGTIIKRFKQTILR